jgi:hypothetical protein
MLTIEQLEQNKKKFKETNKKYSILTQELEDFLGEDFYTSPATTMLDMYGSYPGGLLNNCLKAAKYSIKINDLLPDNVKSNPVSILKCIFISQIGKVFLFKPNKNDWQIKNQGKMYEFNEELVSLKVGERSVYYATKYGVSLTEEEYQAILNTDKDSDDKQAKYYSENLTHVIKMGFELSILEEKNGKK